MRRSVLIVSCFSLLLIAAYSEAQPQISGQLNGTLRAGTYIVVGDIEVGVTDSLIVEPGVTCLFDSLYSIRIYGYLYAVGTEIDSIIFRPNDGVESFNSIIFQDGSSNNSELGYTFITGAAGSAINAYYVNVTISHCTISANRANWGGGIYFSSSNGVISDCVVTDNTAIHNGGGIYCTHSSPTIENCIVLQNYSNYTGGNGSGRGGGGICANHVSSPSITNCIVDDNVTEANGGGIAVNDNSNVTILNCTMNNNSADSSGGGLYISANCTPVVRNCEMHNNTTEMNGTDPEISRCEIYDNEATHGGGLYSFKNDSTEIIHCTFSGNDALQQGGGVELDSSKVQISNTIVEGSTGNGGIHFSDSDTSTVAYCDFHDNLNGDFTGTPPANLGIITTVNANGDTCDDFFNIFLDPLFVDPVSGDFNLQENSPCIDAGDPESPQDPDSTVADIGVHYYEITSIRDQQESHLPAMISVSNYPNPFNPTTTIRFDLPVASQVRLEVFDINGRNVTSSQPPATSNSYPPGKHAITFDGSGLASGIYIYRLTADKLSGSGAPQAEPTTTTASGKMVLIK